MNHKSWCHPSARSSKVTSIYTECCNCLAKTPNSKLKEILQTELAKQGISGNIDFDVITNNLIRSL